VIFRVLGTAAAEGWPALWCTCDACREATRRGGRNLRMRAAYSIDGHIQIDFGPDALAQMWKFGLDYSRLDHLFFTHSHEDHLHIPDLYYRRPGFAQLPEDNLLTIHGNERVRERVDSHVKVLPLLQAQFDVLRLFVGVEVGDLRITPVLADHADDEEAVNFLIEAPGGRLLQGNDTGWYPDQTWDFLSGREIDVALLDCTYGLQSGGGSHLGAPQVVEAKAELQSLGALTPGGRVIATHFSHNGGALHEELTEYFAPHGIEVAYDGMEIEL
jgi:phosphoribosyl 1,2-cyclic phosphate phosphodiesterase